MVSQSAAAARPRDVAETTLTVTLLATGVYDGARFKNEENGFAIWAARKDDGEQVTLVGTLGHCAAGERLECSGAYEKHGRYGYQFAVRDFRSTLPTDADGMKRWIENKVKGIGPTWAQAIVDHFGADQVYAQLDEDPQRLREVRSRRGRAIPATTVETAIVSWGAVSAVRQIETWLYSLKDERGRPVVPTTLADRLYRFYGADVIRTLTEDPYQAADDVKGIGFEKADAIARGLGFAADDPRRLRAGVIYTLQEAEHRDGHVFLSLEEMCTKASKLLKVGDRRGVIEAVQGLAADKRLVVEDDPDRGKRIYLKRLWVQETRLAENVRDLLRTPDSNLFPRPARPVAPEGATLEEIAELKLPTDDQWAVVEMVRTNRFAILDGPPGTGKTFSTNLIVNAAKRAHKVVRLAAPTGKAARRMSELTGEGAETCHRLLEWSPMNGGFQRDEDNPLDADLVVIDETSMTNLEMGDYLLRAIGPHTHVLFVGDPDQLPPIGCGKVLLDLIRSGVVPRVHLTEIQRQAANSMIIRNANRINRGEMPFFSRQEAIAVHGPGMRHDFFFVPCANPDQVRETIVHYVADRLPAAQAIQPRLDPRRDIAVLVPKHDGAAGRHILNSMLEKRLNPGIGGVRPQVVLEKVIVNKGQTREDGIDVSLRVGSRILQTKNDYNYEIMNGELAVVRSWDEIEKEAVLELDDGDRTVKMPVEALSTFELGWALTVHKAQGSEFRCVVAAISEAHYVMLSRPLIYTAVTRASEMMLLIGDKKGVQMAVQPGRPASLVKRNSYLAERVVNPNVSGQLL